MFRDNRNRNKRKNDARSGPICSPVQPKVDESQKAKPVVAAAFRHTTPACFAEELQNLRVALSLSERSQDQILDIIIDSMTQRGASLPSTGSKRDKAGTQEQADAGAEAEVETAAKAEETQADVEAKQADTAEATEGDEAPCGEGGQQVEEVAQGVAQTTDDPLAMLSALTAGYHKDRQKKKEQERLKRRLLRRLRSEARVDAAMEVPKAVVPTAAAAALQQQMGTVPESATSATVRVTLAHDSKPAKAKMCVAPRSNTTKDLIALAVAKLSCKNKPKTPLWCYVAGDPKRTPLEGPCLQAVGNEVSLMFTNSVLDGDAPEAKGDKKEKKEKKDKKDKKDKKEKKDKKAVEEEADNSDEEEGDEGQTEYERLEAQEKLLRSRFEGRAVPDSTLIGPRLLNNPRMSTTPPYIARQRQGLPAHKMRSQILATIEANQVSMIVGATGSGKTTQVPQFIAEEREENDMRAGILVVQPRRLAAVSVADRVARERGEQTGRSVGYQVRFESRFNAATTKIGFVTTGMLLNRLMADPTLSGVTHLILDEVHERSSQLDLVLTLLKTGLDQGALPHLRILLLSATLDSSLFAKYFTVGDQSVPILNIPGRTFPVTINFLDDACRFMQHRTPKDPYVEGLNPQDELYPWLLELYGPQRIQSEPLVSPRAEGKINFELVARLVDFIAKARQREGVKACVLIFMPGVSEISSTIQELQRKGGRYETLPLHSMLTSEEQKRIFSEQGERVRVVVSTNLAETSVTIDGVTDVIDSGYVKEFRYSSSFVQTLGTFWVSHASAQQRAGRAGRTMPGTCWRLFSRQVFDMLPRQTLCEMRRSSMTEAVMFAAMLLGRVQDIPRFLGAAPEPPAPTAVQSAFSMLAGIGVFSEVADPQNQFQYFITPLGFHLAHLPVDPHIGKLLLYGAILGCGGMAATVAACLSTSKSLFMTPYKEGRPDREEEKCVKEVRQTGVGHERSDPIAKARIYDAWCRADGAEQRRLIDFYTLSWSALNEVTKLRDMFVRHLKSMGFRVEAVCPEPTPELSASQLRALRQRRARESVMIRCAVVAGLFPHIACPLKTGSHRTLVSLMSGEQCAVNNRSLNHEESLARYGGLVLKDSEFIAYLDQLRFGASTQSYLTDTTVVHGVQLVLFGGRDARLTLKGKKLDSTVLVDGILSFDCKSSETAMLVRVIRQEIENLFADTILSSGSEEVHERAQKLVGAIFMMLEAEVGSLGAAPEESG